MINTILNSWTTQFGDKCLNCNYTASIIGVNRQQMIMQFCLLKILKMLKINL
jgi:hypothetical protein